MAEPPGKTYSAKYILYVPTNTTKPTVLVYTLPKPVVGVSMVASYVKQTHPVFDWSQLSIEEPIPVIVHGKVYWKVTVTTRDHRGLVCIDVANVNTTEVYSFKPKHKTAYLDVLRVLIKGVVYLEKPPVKTAKDVKAKIRERVEKLIEELNKILKELEEVEKLVNVTVR